MTNITYSADVPRTEENFAHIITVGMVNPYPAEPETEEVEAETEEEAPEPDRVEEAKVVSPPKPRGNRKTTEGVETK